MPFSEGDSRDCKTCGIHFTYFGQRSSLCRECYNKHQADYMLRRYHKRRNAFIESRGSACELCGITNVDFEIDHIESKEKSFAVGGAFTSMAESKLQEELKKCQVLCVDCHFKKTRQDVHEILGIRPYWEHGTISGRRYCDCEDCKLAKRIHNREYKKARKLDNPHMIV